MGLATNAIYDGIKAIFRYLLACIRTRRLTKIKNGKIIENVKPNIHIDFGEMHVVIPSGLDDTQFENFVDKVFAYINSKTVSSENYVCYNEETGELEHYSKMDIAMKAYEKNKSQKTE